MKNRINEIKLNSCQRPDTDKDRINKLDDSTKECTKIQHK